MILGLPHPGCCCPPGVHDGNQPNETTQMLRDLWMLVTLLVAAGLGPVVFGALHALASQLPAADADRPRS